jgi:2-C-methyl-D-erythritol 2,4-cyclodiphosphate synthase
MKEEGGMRIGLGYDVHRLVEGRRLILGGVEIPFEKGLLGHSDADVLLHAVCDALLGAAGAGDIGRHFPDTDSAYKDIDSMKLLAETYRIVQEKGFSLGNLDATVFAQAPKIAPFHQRMSRNIAAVLAAAVDRVNIKATTTEGLGMIGSGDGIAAMCIALLEKEP